MIDSLEALELLKGWKYFIFKIASFFYGTLNSHSEHPRPNYLSNNNKKWKPFRIYRATMPHSDTQKHRCTHNIRLFQQSSYSIIKSKKKLHNVNTINKLMSWKVHCQHNLLSTYLYSTSKPSYELLWLTREDIIWIKFIIQSK